MRSVRSELVRRLVVFDVDAARALCTAWKLDEEQVLIDIALFLYAQGRDLDAEPLLEGISKTEVLGTAAPTTGACCRGIQRHLTGLLGLRRSLGLQRTACCRWCGCALPTFSAPTRPPCAR